MSDRPAGAAESAAERLARLERAAASGGAEAPQALAELARLAGQAGSLEKAVAKELRRVLFRLRSRGIVVEPVPAGPGQQGEPAPGGAVGPAAGVRPLRAAASAIDALGQARLEMSWELPREFWRVRAVVSDGRGLEAFEAVRVGRREATGESGSPNEPDLQPMPGEWGAAMLAGAAALARRLGSGLPRGYAVVRAQLEPGLPDGADGPYGWARRCWSQRLQEALADPDRVRLWARASAALLETGEVDWELGDWIGPLLDEARRQLATRLVLLPATRRSVAERLAMRMSEVLHAPPSRERLSARLAYVALRLDRADRMAAARLAAAGATLLADPQASERVGVLEALAARHLAPYLMEEERGSARAAAAGREGGSGLVLPPTSP
ncbi:MAG TPA: hypothetical protein VIK90_06915 [Limnochordales bacterium]